GRVAPHLPLPGPQPAAHRPGGGRHGAEGAAGVNGPALGMPACRYETRLRGLQTCPMKITELRVYPTDVGNCNRVFTEMFTDEGIIGISEVTIRRKGMTVAASIRELERFLVGKDPTCIEHHWEQMYR